MMITPPQVARTAPQQQFVVMRRRPTPHSYGPLRRRSAPVRPLRLSAPVRPVRRTNRFDWGDSDDLWDADLDTNMDYDRSSRFFR